MSPNRLTDKQIADRPACFPFLGMLFYCISCPGGEWFAMDDFDLTNFSPENYLLPGEPGCPWPPPMEFRREWKDGDRAWIADHVNKVWIECRVSVNPESQDTEPLCFYSYYDDFPIDTPAIYIPEGSA